VASDRLEFFARDFAKTIQHLLNSTICTGATINSVVGKPGTVVVAHKLRKKLLESEPLPVRRGRGKPHCYLDLSYSFCWDETRDYPAVESSFLAVRAPDSDRTVLCHFDYERGKTGGYPEAHVQIYGQAPALAVLPRAQGRPLGKYHFPVGGRRYRPILEDVIEFLVAEGLVPELPDGAAEVIQEGRDAFHRTQLRAAIRRDPDIAIQALREWGLTPTERTR
jgi:GNAT superfamily N-acetyltransferase